MRAGIVKNFAAAGIFFAAAAGAQTTGEAGVEQFWYRDIVQTGVPVDGSPISWEGSGPGFAIVHDRGTPGRLHRFEGWFATMGSFALESPVRSLPAPSADSASRIAGRYEYRRYPFRDLWWQGFDVGIGIEGDVEHLSLSRHFDPGIELLTSLNQFGVSGVVTAQFHRGRLDLSTSWGNGLSMGHSTARHRSAVEVSTALWGGGWQTNWLMHAGVRASGRASLVAGYLTSGEGRLSGHETFSYGRSRFTLGVTYAH